MITNKKWATLSCCCTVLLALSGCAADPNGSSLDPPPLMNFLYPVSGILNKDIFHVFYFGHVNAAGLVNDYNCGIKVQTFTGSEIMAPYYSYLDSNVVVVAAAAGTVTEAYDGDADLRTGGERGPVGLGNYVRIEHREERGDAEREKEQRIHFGGQVRSTLGKERKLVRPHARAFRGAKRRAGRGAT